MRILLDTNRYTDLARGVPEIVARIRGATEIWLPLFALGELRAGFVGGTRKNRNETALANFFKWPNTGVLLPNEATAVFTLTFTITCGGRPRRSRLTTYGLQLLRSSMISCSMRGTNIFSMYLV